MVRWLLVAVFLILAFTAGVYTSPVVLKGVIDGVGGRLPFCVGHVTVLNGDTIECDGWRIQLSGFDAPETRGVRGCEIEQGLKAKQHLERAIAGKRLSVHLTVAKGDFGDSQGDLNIDGSPVAESVLDVKDDKGKPLFCASHIEDWCVPDPC